MSDIETFPRPRRRKGSGAVTLRDVAQIAGVAPITASRAINNPAQVSQEVRERVAEAVRKTGYVPNLLAGALSSMKSGANTLGYQLYLDSGRTTVFGDGTASSSTKSGTGSGSAQSISVYGRVPTLAGVVPGSYTDTVTVTITY